MLNSRKLISTSMLLFCIGAPVQAAEFFTGYVVESRNGVTSENPNFDSSLVGLSASPTGPVALYRFTSDRTYAEMLANARIHRQFVNVSYSGGTITGVYINR